MPEAAVIDLPLPPGPAVVVAGLSLSLGGRRVLDGVDFSLRRSGISALMGPNGAGKSLTLRVLAGLVRPDAGTVRYPDGLPRARDLALVFQKPVLLRRSVRGNLLHALATYRVPRRERGDRVAELLHRTELDALGDAPARRLSGGEQQRLALARALAAEPRFLLLDEPTASLDPQSTAAIEALVRRASANGVKVVLVTHERSQAARLADEVVFLHRGRVAEVAPARRFLEAPASPEARAYLRGDLLI